MGQTTSGLWWRWYVGGCGYDDGDTYRAVYTVRSSGFVYVLHAFQKKSTSSIATPRYEIALIEQRLKRAKEDFEPWLTGTPTKSR